MKRVLFLILTLMLLCATLPAASAASAEATAAADELYELGLFNGKGTGANGRPIYALDDVPTRHEAVTMLVRLLGKEAEAKAGKWNIPFTDVADWAKPYVGYAYANGLTAGTGDGSTFSGTDKVNATQYLTFVLRALGYSSSTDFQWDKAWELTDKLGLTHGEYPSDTFLRGNIALISVGALNQNLKGSSTTLRTVVTEPSAPVETNVISLVIPAIGSTHSSGSNLGTNCGTHSFQVLLNGTPVSSFTAVLENPAAATLTANGSSLILEITAPGPNAVNITVGNTSARFYWDAQVTDPFSTGIVLHDPFKGNFFFPDKATGLLYGTFVFEVRLDGQPVSDYTAVCEKNDGCAAIVTPGGRLELRIKKGSSNAVNITANGQTARFFWEN